MNKIINKLMIARKASFTTSNNVIYNFEISKNLFLISENSSVKYQASLAGKIVTNKILQHHICKAIYIFGLTDLKKEISIPQLPEDLKKEISSYLGEENFE